MLHSTRLILPRLLAAITMLLCFATPASAQNDMALATSPALACLTIPGGASLKPDYPENSLNRKEGGTVRVQLEFRAPGDKPRVKLLDRAMWSELNDAVESHVRQFRVPCMQEADGPVILVQKYVFDPDQGDRVMASPTRDLADIQRAAAYRCMRHPVPNSKPRYPSDALRNGEEGNFIVKLHFSAPDQAPAVEFAGGPNHRSLRHSITNYAEELRLPCLQGQPVDVMIAYKFVLSGGARTLLRDGGLKEVLGSAKDLARPAYFDFNTMDCPFDVRLTYYRPFANNKVQQLDTAVAARQPFLDWLEGMSFNLDEQTSAKVFGNKMVISVSCGKLDI
ncbi:hypothetical protein Q4S45_16650 [Massilia sp. R2A-15]|uniref:hypothetical protein n=1 Tax=Massilia sp. R2A-15 TaxID=3064278 RepID=UPI00273424C3|nr:hypothetical protein [Massilia sp. R2A-15]WLI88348.1 hypothetical protein Q4S45_16650 [Massilia sp. R2A-15]